MTLMVSAVCLQGVDQISAVLPGFFLSDSVDNKNPSTLYSYNKREW